jgi:hypothetical protein
MEKNHQNHLRKQSHASGEVRGSTDYIADVPVNTEISP